MVTLTAKIAKVKNNVWLYIRRYSRINKEQKEELLKIGESVIIEGGPSTGKTKFLHGAKQKLENERVPVIFIQGSLPLGDWVKDYRLFGKSLEKRVAFFLTSLPKDYYLIIDDAEKVQDSRKLDVVLTLLANARSVIIGCGRIGLLNPKLRARLKDCRTHNLGTGGDTFDITYFVVAVLILFVVVAGAINLVFLAAAMRYLFMGTRIGGKA